MTPDRDAIRDRVATVRERIAAAAARAGRSASDVTLVAITKTFPAAAARLAVESGLTDLGENRVQEAAPKIAEQGPGPVWHLVGRLQTNKARDAAALFSLIHSLDRIELANALNRAGEMKGRPVSCLVQVNVTGAGTQGGVAPADLPALVESCVKLPYLRIGGVMAIGPHGAAPEAIRAAFREAGAARDRVRELAGPEAGALSAGMSDDFEIAVEEGSTLVRIGRTIFGERSAA